MRLKPLLPPDVTPPSFLLQVGSSAVVGKTRHAAVSTGGSASVPQAAFQQTQARVGGQTATNSTACALTW